MTPTAAAPASPWSNAALALPLGAAFGFALSRIGFTDFGEVHRMFIFADLRLFLVFVGAVLCTGVGTLALGRWRSLPSRRVHRGVVVGGVLFGLGWAISGACPGAAIAQLGEGKVYSLATLAGIALGTLLYHTTLGRRASPDEGGCG